MIRDEYDVVILGGDTAAMGVTRPTRAAGLSVAMIESRDLGGTCPNRGCTPKKILVAAAHELDEISRASAHHIKIASPIGRNIVEGAVHRPDYTAIPSCVYTIPALASVGMTEDQAKSPGLAYKVHINDMSEWLSARTYVESAAWSKIIVDERTDRVLGAHILDHSGEELISVLTLAMRHGITATDLTNTIYGFPTFSADIRSMM
jgi:pyruvate/2-oxoglutarate dehydrogenase complex dihydrolipoamide dehydrogenase (E3) component